MRLKVLLVIHWVVILALTALLLKPFLAPKASGPAAREPQAPGESTLVYEPPPAPKLSAADLLRLAALKKENAAEVEKVTDRVYLARGFALGNVAMIETDDGLVIVDTTESRAAAEEILARFREITDRPIKTIIYTHGHRDHTLGTPVFFKPGVEVIATHRAVEFLKAYREELGEFLDRSRASQSGRLAEAYALELPYQGTYRPEADAELIWPTTTFEGRLAFELGGVEFELYATAGETPDHLMIWLPRERVLFPGDLYYESFPNLSSPMLEPRPVKAWAESLERMIALNPAHLVPGHTRAVSGEEAVREALSLHKRAVRFVYEMTVKAINRGLSVEEAVAAVRLPPELAEKRQLREVYGRVDWSVRGIYQGLTGWYDGRGSGLNPLPRSHLSREVLALAGGADKLLARAIALQKTGEHQLAAELCDLAIDANPQERLARTVKAASLDHLGYASGNLNMFGFYRSAAALERQAAAKRR